MGRPHPMPTGGRGNLSGTLVKDDRLRGEERQAIAQTRASSLVARSEQATVSIRVVAGQVNRRSSHQTGVSRLGLIAENSA